MKHQWSLHRLCRSGMAGPARALYTARHSQPDILPMILRWITEPKWQLIHLFIGSASKHSLLQYSYKLKTTWLTWRKRKFKVLVSFCKPRKDGNSEFLLIFLIETFKNGDPIDVLSYLHSVVWWILMWQAYCFESWCCQEGDAALDAESTFFADPQSKDLEPCPARYRLLRGSSYWVLVIFTKNIERQQYRFWLADCKEEDFEECQQRGHVIYKIWFKKCKKNIQQQGFAGGHPPNY